MRSYEYTLDVGNVSNHHTITVRTCDIKKFKHDIKILPTSHIIQLADYNTITLRLRKHDEADETLIIHTNSDP